jgi:hypothetical protein
MQMAKHSGGCQGYHLADIQKARIVTRLTYRLNASFSTTETVR